MKAEILSFEEFAKIRESKNLGKIIAVSGGFDPLHSGHLYYIHESKKLGDILVAIVNGDNFLRNKKGKPFMFHNERMDILSHIKSIDYVIPYETFDDHTCIVALQKLKPDVFAKSGDRVDKKTIPEWQTCVDNKIEIIIIPPAPTDDVHSSKYLERWFMAKLKMKFKFIVNPYNRLYFYIATRLSEKSKNKIKKIIKK